MQAGDQSGKLAEMPAVRVTDDCRIQQHKVDRSKKIEAQLQLIQVGGKQAEYQKLSKFGEQTEDVLPSRVQANLLFAF